MTKQSGLLINEARKISERDRRRITASLSKRLCKGVDIAGVLAGIESAIQNYWACFEAEQQQQKRSQIANELLCVAECAATFPQRAAELSGALESLGPDADESLEQALERGHVSERSYLSLADIQKHLRRFINRSSPQEFCNDPELRKRIRQLRCAALDFQPRGRPRQDAAGVLINILALVYEGATGKWPGRTWDPNCGYSGRERHPYFEACFRAAGLSGKDSKKKLAMLRPILKAGKAQRTPRTKVAKQSRQSEH